MSIESNQKIRKPVSTLAIIPKTGSITKLGRQAYTIMLLLARDQGSEDRDTGMFYAPLHSIIEGFDGNKESMKVIKSSLRSMVSTVIEWQSPTEGESVEWNASALLAGVKIKIIKGENHVYWAYAPNSRHELLNPQRYAQLQKSTISKARSYAGLALYENCVRYKDVPSGLTSEHPWEWWIDVLRGKRMKPGSKLEYGIFKRDTLNKAIAEVNEISEITVTLLENKSGKSVTTIQFEVKKKPRLLLEHEDDDSRAPVSIASLVKAEKLGVPAKTADALYGKFGDKKLLKALNKLAMRLEQKTSPVGNTSAYLKTILENDHDEEASADAITALDQRVKTDLEVTVKASTPPLNTVQAGQMQKVEQGVVQLETAKTEIAALPAHEKEALVAELRTYAVQQKWAPRMILRLEAGELENPMIQGALAKLHWKKTRGADWITS